MTETKCSLLIKKKREGVIGVKFFPSVFFSFPCSHFRNETAFTAGRQRVLHINSHSEGQ